MNYQPGKTPHGLPHDPFKSCAVPRPIGWISTRSKDGVDNLAPFSQFTNVSFDPPIVMFSANHNTRAERKDSVINAEQSGAFIWNMATYALREAVNITAEEFPRGVDEFERAGLEKVEGLLVPAARVAASPVQFECRYLQTVTLPGNGPMGTAEVVFGRVDMIHIADEIITADGRIDVLRVRPLARLGYYDYTSVESTFEMVVAGGKRALAGLEGSPAGNL